MINYLLDGDASKDLTQKQFIKKMLNCKESIKYDFLSTSGYIKKYLKIIIIIMYLFRIRSIFESLLQ